MKLTKKQLPKLKFHELVTSANIAKHMDRTVLDTIGNEVVMGYQTDFKTRDTWEERMREATKLALQVKEYKSWPWVGCSNVKFPIVTIASLQFLARIALLTKGASLAKTSYLGADPRGEKAAQAARISKHLSLQLTEFSPNWVGEDEQAKLSAAILGSAFKKTYYDPISGQIVSEHIPIANFVVDYYTKDLERANRITQKILMSGNDIQERVRRGLFLEVSKEESESAGHPLPSTMQHEIDETEGLHAPTETAFDMFMVLEQHCWYDLDGDGYAEPYIISVMEKTGQVLRIVARFTDTGDVHRINDAAVRQFDQMAMEETDLTKRSTYEKRAQRLKDAPDNHIVRIDAIQYYTRLLFIPSPDDGFYGLGFGVLLGPLNESVNTLVNQLIDAGTMSNTAGGFLGRGVKMKGGMTNFAPFEWKPIDSPGADLRQNIFPLPVREPSSVLFQLLGMLVTYSEKVGSATDIMTGVSPGQNTPAETSRNTVEQGMMLFSSIYARIHRSFRDELRRFYQLNKLYFHSSPQYFELTKSKNAILAPTDYSDESFLIYPAVSPDSASQTQKREKAAALVKMSEMEPGFNRYLVMRKFLEAFDYDDIDLIYPDPKGPNAIQPVTPPKIAIEQQKLQFQQEKHQDEMKLAVAKLQESLRVSEATINELNAKAAQEMAKANGTEVGHQIALLDAQLAAENSHKKHIQDAIAMLHKINVDTAQIALQRDAVHNQQSAQHQQPQQQPAIGATENGNHSSGSAGMGA